MNIKNIRKLNNGKYKVTFDNGKTLNLHDEVILDNNLLYKKEINQESLERINNDNEYYNDYSKVLKYITIKMRSEYEIKKYMEKNNLEPLEQEKILNKLKANNLINDKLFVEAFISDKINLTNDGPYKIKNELLKHNIDINTIENELSKYNDDDFISKIQKYISKKVSSNSKDSLFMLKQKLMQQLINLGYDKGMINGCLDNIRVDNTSIIETEYNKLYKKLSNKYEGDNLYYEIKNRLYKKGFNIDDINNIIKKSD